MEVHHHPNVEKKNFKEYFLEFLMIFLAVMMGFFAENFREKISEHYKEEEYLKLLTEDLKDDRQNLEQQITQTQVRIAMMDSLIFILNDPSLISANGSKLYYFGRQAPRLLPFTNNMRTYEQLKNSGNFRLIRDMETSNMIMSYYDKIPKIQQQENNYAAELSAYKQIASKVFEPSVLRKLENEEGDIIRASDNPPLRKADPDLLKEMSVYLVYMNGSRKKLLLFEKDLLKTADELISYLQRN
jgi:hypothetical protein